MKQNILTFFFVIFLFTSFGQITHFNQFQHRSTYLKFSGGRVAFGTGDYFGYSFGFEASKNIITEPVWGLAKFLVGGEMIFENGAENPVIENPTIEEFYSKTFYHTSNTILWPKVSYYPLKKIVKGFNIQLGPTVGYSNRSQEVRADLMADASGASIRQSYLSFHNGFTIGYRISTGIEVGITKKFQAGFRLDFSNNNKGEINTLIGLKAGIIF